MCLASVVTVAVAVTVVLVVKTAFCGADVPGCGDVEVVEVKPGGLWAVWGAFRVLAFFSEKSQNFLSLPLRQNCFLHPGQTAGEG